MVRLNMNNKKIVIAGGSGFLGMIAAHYFKDLGYDIIILSRSKSIIKDNIRFLQWDGNTISDWTLSFEDAEAVINLTGKSINCIHTPENKKEIIESRVNSVRVIQEAILGCKNPPKVYIQVAGISIYGDKLEQCDEDSNFGTDFLAEVSKLWEAEVAKQPLPATRKVILRMGIALGKNGGALQPLIKVTKLFLGGSVGSGKQYLSWFHTNDFKSVLDFAIQNRQIEGAYNFCSPNPVTNAEFMKTLRKCLHRPWAPPAPAFAVKIVAKLFLKTEGYLALISNNSIPKRLLQQGFKFQYTDLTKALEDLV